MLPMAAMIVVEVVVQVELLPNFVATMAAANQVVATSFSQTSCSGIDAKVATWVCWGEGSPTYKGYKQGNRHGSLVTPSSHAILIGLIRPCP